MKSKAHIKGHPLHLILVSFPVAFFIGTWLFDLLSLVFHSPSFFQTGFYLETAGIFFALCAAVPGILDYVYSIPPDSTAKSRAAQHGLLNVTVTALFTGALCYRILSAQPSSLLLIGMETIAAILLGVAGWMGGTLVVRNQIGIDIRYAGAGKWKELHLKEKDGEVELGSLAELKPDQMILILVDGKRIVVAKTKNDTIAFEDRCTHRGGSLAAGTMICGTVQCPWHGSQFEGKTGAIKAGPAKIKLETYRVKELKGISYLLM